MRQKFEKLELKAKRGPDDSFKRIVFLGMPKMLYEKRIQYLESYMKDKFPSIKYVCSVYFRKGDGKDRVMTDTGYVEFVSSDVRDFVLKLIDADEGKFKFNIEGKAIAIRRARTRRATERNAALRTAAETLKKLADMDNDVEIEWGRDGGQRGVKVKGTYAFTQPSGDSLGNFAGEFEHLDL